jgi:flagellar hook-basal body complex protein FliE
MYAEKSINTQNDENKSETTVLGLEILNTKYNNLLVQYKHAVSNYVDYLNNQQTSSSSKTLTYIKGQTFWGTGQAGNQAAYTNITDVNSCTSLCLKTSNCTGATFNPSNYGKPMCWLRTGDGEPIQSTKPDDYAIILFEKQLLNNIKNINKELINTNNEILYIINNNSNQYENETTKRLQKASLLLENYKKLNQERIKIDNMVKEYENLDEVQNEGSLRANENYYSFLLLLLLAILVILLLYKSYDSVIFDSLLGMNAFTIVAFILLLIFIYYVFLRNIL